MTNPYLSAHVAKHQAQQRRFALIASLLALVAITVSPSAQGQAATKARPSSTTKSTEKAGEKSDKAATKAAPEAPIENVVSVTTTELVDKPHEFLNKNVKFSAKFFAFSTLPLDYKPAMKSSKTHLGFMVLRPDGHVPLSELKIAMAMPKEKDPINQLLTSLKDGDQVEIIAKVFGAPLDEPWVDVLRLKKLASAADDKEKDKKDEKAASSSEHELPKELQPDKHPADIHAK